MIILTNLLMARIMRNHFTSKAIQKSNGKLRYVVFIAISSLLISFSACRTLKMNTFSSNNKEANDSILISGTVIDAITHLPLNGAFELINGDAKGTFSDSTGYFTLKVLNADTIHISYIGFKTKRISASDLTAGPTIALDTINTVLIGNPVVRIKPTMDLQWLYYENGPEPFIYVNGEWYPWFGKYNLDDIPYDKIIDLKVKDDDYGNRAVFVEYPSEIADSIKNTKLDYFINTDPVVLFGGKGNDADMIKYIQENQVIPDGAKERVVVRFFINPDGSVSDASIIKAAKNEAINKDAIQLVNSLPKFKVIYLTPQRTPIYRALPIVYNDTSKITLK